MIETREEIRMTAAAHVRNDPFTERAVSGRIVVGVDGSDMNAAAVEYALTEAAASGRPLTLVAVLAARLAGHVHPVALDDEREWGILSQVTEASARRFPRLDVRRELQIGDPAGCLLDASVGQALLVVGKRGLGTFGRILLGSTSATVAARSLIPVVVVPGRWQVTDHIGEPVVVGVDGEHDNSDVLRFAFCQAERRSVGVTVVNAMDSQPRLVWDVDLEAAILVERKERAAADLSRMLETIRSEFPTVPVRTRQPHGDAGTVLLDEARKAQLLVIGRSQGHAYRFRLGRVTRAVLHYAGLPVAVVPST